MPTLSTQVLIYGVLVLAGLLLGAYLCYRILNSLRRQEGKLNQRRGRKAEREALQLLEAEGFRVVEVEPRLTMDLVVNGDEETFEITPDALVEKDGQQYLVEVKRYTDNIGIANAHVRRQVLEYLYAADLPCLLVRMPEGDIDLIEL